MRIQFNAVNIIALEFTESTLHACLIYLMSVEIYLSKKKYYSKTKKYFLMSHKLYLITIL